MTKKMEKNKEAKELAFVVPTDVSPTADVTKLTNEMLQRYHDVMHLLWKKLFDGLGEFHEFKWTFNSVIHKHYQVIEEMWKRRIYHYEPFDSLDKIDYHDYGEKVVVSELSKEDKKEDISFEPGFINRIKKQ